MSDNGFINPIAPGNYFNYHTAVAQEEAERQRKIASEREMTIIQERSKNQDMASKVIQQEIEHQQKIANLHKTIARKQAEVNHYQNLLTKPMSEIAEHSADFKRLHELEKRKLASWMMSQKTMKETVFKLAEEAGKTGEEVKEMIKESYNNVINDKSKYGNNASDNPVTKEFKDDIKKNGMSL